MDRIEDPADAEVMLQNSLRILAMSAKEQISLFEPHCVACCVRVTFSGWEEQFAEAPFVTGMAEPQKSALSTIRKACQAILADPSFKCDENSYVCESPPMEALRQAAGKALAQFGWSPGAIERKYVPGTPECGERRTRLFWQRKYEKRAARPMEAGTPRFHAATFQMHCHPLARNRSRITDIDRWEKIHGVKLPAAVREWYEMEGNDLWERIRPRDKVFSLDELELVQPARVRAKSEHDAGDGFYTLWGASSIDLQVVELFDSYQYLLVYAETDVGIPSLVRMDGTDDPPVFIKPEGGDPLRFISPRFSVFQFDELTDARFADYKGTIIVRVDHRLPTEHELERLRAALSEGPVSQGGWPGWNFRFFTSDAFVACGLDYYALPSEEPFWEFRAMSNEALLKVLRVVWPVANLAKKLERKVMSLGISGETLKAQ